MPTGTTKVTLFAGESITPGGTVVFNASGTWIAPKRVTTVSITGKGGNGTPGNPGQPGNAGSPSPRALGGGGGAGGGN